MRLLKEVKDLFDRGRFTFQKCEFDISRAGIAAIGYCALTLARAEGLDAHANAVALRLRKVAA